MKIGTVWQKLTGTGQAVDVAQAEAALTRLVTGQRTCEEAVQRLGGELATLDEQRAAVELEALVEGESSDLDEQRRALLERQRATADELDTKRRLLEHLAPAIAQAETTRAEARYEAEQREFHRLVSDYASIAGELRQRLADVTPLAERLGQLWSAMETRHAHLAAVSRELKRVDLVGLPDGLSLGEVVTSLREAHARGLNQAEPFSAERAAAPVEGEEEGDTRDEVDAPVAADLRPEPVEAPLPVATFEDNGHLWALRPLAAEAHCRPTADVSCKYPAVYHATYEAPGGRSKAWALCQVHSQDFATRHHLQVPA